MLPRQAQPSAAIAQLMEPYLVSKDARPLVSRHYPGHDPCLALSDLWLFGPQEGSGGDAKISSRGQLSNFRQGTYSFRPPEVLFQQQLGNPTAT